MVYIYLQVKNGHIQGEMAWYPSPMDPSWELDFFDSGYFFPP